MFRYLSPIALTLWATCSTAAIQSSDFWFHDDGETIFIDGKRGAPLHIDYIGAPLTNPLTVRVTPDNTNLKVSPSTCTFTKKDDDCRLIVQLKKQGQKVYGVNHFTLTEEGASKQGVLNPQAASDTSTVGFGVGVQGKDMPAPIKWAGSNTMSLQTGKVIVTNAATGGSGTASIDYKVVSIYKYAAYLSVNGNIETKVFSLPSRKSCYIDNALFADPNPQYEYFFKASAAPFLMTPTANSIVQDISSHNAPVFNGYYGTGNNNISTCSAQGEEVCASNKWASWTIGLANLSSTDMDGGVKAGQIEVLRDNSWNNNATIYYSKSWSNSSLALLQIQGSTDGGGFDANAAAPNIIEVQSAPPCSDYIIR